MNKQLAPPEARSSKAQVQISTIYSNVDDLQQLLLV
jgi:hypothetical protein